MPVDVGGSPAVVIEETREDDRTEQPWKRVLYVDRGQGNLIAITAWGSPPSVDELVTMAASLTRTTETAWNRTAAPLPNAATEP